LAFTLRRLVLSREGDGQREYAQEHKRRVDWRIPGGREGTMPREPHGLPPGQAIARMAEGYRVCAALRTMVVLDLADHLAAGPRTVVELARASGTHVPSLARLLRALVALDLCAYDDAGRVQLTPLGDTLRADTPESMQVYVRMSTSAWF